MKSAVLLLLLTTACGGDDGMQMCGADHCGLQGHTIVKWTFDSYPEWLFPMDSCVDFNASKVRVDAELISDPTQVTTAIDDCGAGQVTFDGLPSGDYTMYLDPEDIGLASLVNGPTVITPVTAGEYQNDTTVSGNVPYTSWVGSFSGTFLFKLTWGGMPCATATTPVVKQTVALTVNGQPVALSTDDGEPLDGTTKVACYDSVTTGFPQSAKLVPFGPAQITVQGFDAGDVLVYTSTIDTFVGAGITNPTITYDVKPMM